MSVGVVIPVGGGREENLEQVLGCIAAQTEEPVVTVLVYDGPDAHPENPGRKFSVPVVEILAPKHRPGLEQPRNLGVRMLRQQFPEATHVAFLDSDVIFQRDLLQCYRHFMELGGTDGLWYGPYEWMGPGRREIDIALRNDPRTAMFLEEVSLDEVPGVPPIRYTKDLSKGLGAFSGNLIWNIEDFVRVGGFWNELHHGRCEDGELGLRAVHMGVPIGLAPDCRGWHLEHPVAHDWKVKTNAIDVPKINDRHVWMKDPSADGYELFVVDEDGKRFNARCVACGGEFNTGEIWAHQEGCNA